MAPGERPALPFELVREAVINALVHRDYDLTGAMCHLVVTADTVTVRSPGAPLAPIRPIYKKRQLKPYWPKRSYFARIGRSHPERS